MVDDIFKKNLSASFQKTIAEIIITKLKKNIGLLIEKKINIQSISVVGGVANNDYIKKKLEILFDQIKIELYYPVKEMMSDNAAMIAWACLKKYKYKENDIFFKPDPRLKIKDMNISK